MTPIATVSIGTDPVSQLQQQVVVVAIEINAESESVVVKYKIQTLAPNGTVVAQTSETEYQRDNIAGDMRFDALRSSAVGQTLVGMIQNDLSKWPNLQQ